MAKSKNRSRKKTKMEPLGVTEGDEVKKVGRAKLWLLPSLLRGLTEWIRSLVPASPHRSFRRTYQRDYARSLKMPGYISFTVEVWRTMWRFKSVLVPLVFVYSILSGLLVGLASQNTYTQMTDALQGVDGDSQGIGDIGKAWVLLLVSFSGGLDPNLTEGQQIISSLLVLMVWLTTIWLLRAYLAGHRPNLKDGIYNAGAPIVPTVLIALIIVAQLIPAAIAAIGVSAAMPTGLIREGVEAMIFWAAIALLVLMSLYWLVSSIVALVVVTLPGMYPLRAMKTASELVVGRRPRVLFRLAWLALITLLIWAIIMIPIILFDSWAKESWAAISWIPIVPVSLLLMSSALTVWISSYVYLMYRKVVDDDAAPA